MIEKIKKFREYLDYIERHYNNVQKAWKLIQEKCKDFHFIYDDNLFFELDGDIKNHDLSKLSSNEFTQYRQFFFPCEGEEKNKDLFKQAWEHHKAENTHHWQTWTLDGFGSAKQELALIHNIVDWVAMGFEFNDTAKAYYETNKEDIKLPDWAINLMYEVFDCIYPSDGKNI